MPNFVSPGVYTVEQDFSDYIGSVNTSIVGIVGFASKGPVNQATLVTAGNDLVTIFGNPSEDIYGQGLEGAVAILATTNALYFVRAATDEVADASAIVNVGACPAVIIKEGDYGVTTDLYLRVQAMSPGGEKAYPGEGEVFHIAPAPGRTQGEAIQAVLPGALASDRISAYADNSIFGDSEDRGVIVGFWAGSGACLTVTASEDASFDEDKLLDVVAAMDTLGEVSGLDGAETIPGDICYNTMKIYGPQINPIKMGSNLAGKNFGYLVESIYPGAGYNEGITPAGNTSGNSVRLETQGGANVALNVYNEGSVAEPGKFISFVEGSFVEDVINIGSVNATSDYIKGNLFYEGARSDVFPLTHFMQLTQDLGFTPGELEGMPPRFLTGNGSIPPDAAFADATIAPTDPRFLKMVEGSYGLEGGDNGVDVADIDGISAALIGDSTANPPTGLKQLDNDILNISVAAVPGVSIEGVQSALIALAQLSQNFIAAVAPPYGLGSVQKAIAWSNGQYVSRTNAINSSYAAIYWPWVQALDANGTARWFDPAIFGIQSMCYTDGVAETWFAPAGEGRGALANMNPDLTVQGVERNLNQGDRDTMYSGGNVVNPIVGFPQRGIMVFGQRTSQRKPSALDRINVRRLMIFIRKAILGSTRQFIFEPNDAFTWERITRALNPFLGDIKSRRGITEFRVVCDETTNTPARVDRNEMWCKVLIKPTKTAEMIIFELNLTSQAGSVG
jgi:phage tail sheath protein FI